MDGDVVAEENGNTPVLPLSPELIGTINGIEPSILKANHLRKIRRILSGMIDGCVVIVVDGGVIESVYQVKNYIIGPAEK
jgi:hypothetical protein